MDEPEEKKMDPGSQSGMTQENGHGAPSPGSPKASPTSPSKGRGAPRWVTPFLRSLERTGQVEAAARDAGIDKSTAYGRRRAHADFAEEWDAALARGDGAEAAAVEERAGFWERVRGKVTGRMLGIEAGTRTVPLDPDAPSPGSPEASPTSPSEGRGMLREELMATTALGGQMKRVGPGRFGKAAEARFFEELAATSNLRRACAAAGVSTNAVHARRLKRPDFDAKCRAVLETGRAVIDMHLVETTRKAFDPDQLDIGEVQPKVSVAEAIRIVQLHGKASERKAIEPAERTEAEVEAARERIVRKLERMNRIIRAENLAAGWSLDESYDVTVPPGWVKGPDYKPKPPDPPQGPDFWEQIANGQ